MKEEEESRRREKKRAENVPTEVSYRELKKKEEERRSTCSVLTVNRREEGLEARYWREKKGVESCRFAKIPSKL